MKKSINLYCNYEISTEEKLKAFKDAGYDSFYTTLYNINDIPDIKEQLVVAKNVGLVVGDMIHCSYYEPELNLFWETGETGDKICESYIKQIEMCNGMWKNFVIHLNGDNGVSRQTEIGLDRIKKILKVCEKYDTNLCIENLHSEEELPYIFSNISHKNLKICYDTGHKNYLTPNLKICETLGKHIAVLHIHENNGLQDEHKPLTIGSKVFNRLAEELKLVDKNIVLSAELKVSKSQFYDAIKTSYKSFCVLDKTLNG